MLKCMLVSKRLLRTTPLTKKYACPKLQQSFLKYGGGKKIQKAFDFLFRYGNVWWHQHPLMAGSISEIMMLEFFFLDTCV